MNGFFTKDRKITAQHTAGIVFVLSWLIVFSGGVFRSGFSYSEGIAFATGAAIVLALAAYVRTKILLRRGKRLGDFGK